MKKLIIFLLAAMPLICSAKSEKRGVCENNFTVGAMIDALEPGVSWYYNWGNKPNTGYKNSVIENTSLEYVPMCWNANYDANAIREYCKSHPTTKYLLGFNEPNFTKQANMTPQQAAEAWPAVKALADELNLKLVAPALNYSPNPPYTDPLKWMDEFVALVGIDAFDYTAVHNYGGLGVMKRIAGDFHDKYGKPVWVTEFCYWPDEGNANSYVSPDTQINSMLESIQWLEETDWIFRYAWFKPMGNSDSKSGPNYGLLLHTGKEVEDWGLSEQGAVYVYYPAGTEGFKHTVGMPFNAIEAESAEGVSYGASANPDAEIPLEISKFSGGASLTWKIDVPSAGDYTIMLRVSGVGEPVRFNPTLALTTVKKDGTDGETLAKVENFDLPGADDRYTDMFFEVKLEAGEQLLRLRDINKYQPSGIRISTVNILSGTGVDEIYAEGIAADACYYDLQGRPCGNNASLLAPGIYIRMAGGKASKVIL